MPFTLLLVLYHRLFTPFFAIFLILGFPCFVSGTIDPPPPAVDDHIARIASFAKSSPQVIIPEGWFLMGTIRRDDMRHSLETHYDDTEFPQRRIWVDEIAIDRYEVNLGEYLAFLLKTNRPVSQELKGLIWHLMTVHFIPEQALVPSCVN
jgi:iron(II)-dependent oxidoreductase